MDQKPGWQTTEFWVTGATVAGGFVLAFVSSERAATIAQYADSGASWLGVVAAVTAGLSAGLYALARALTKRG